MQDFFINKYFKILKKFKQFFNPFKTFINKIQSNANAKGFITLTSVDIILIGVDISSAHQQAN